MNRDEYKSMLVQKLVEDPSIQSSVQQVCQLIGDLAFGGKEALCFEDLIKFELITECVSRAIKGTADILYEKLGDELLKQMEKDNVKS